MMESSSYIDDPSRVRIYSSKGIHLLLADNMKKKTKVVEKKMSRADIEKMKKTERLQAQMERLRKEHMLKDEAMKREVENAKARIRAAKNAEFEANLVEVNGLRAYVAQIDHTLDHLDGVNKKKRQQLYEEWVEKVYKPTEKALREHVDSKDVKTMEAELHSKFEDYLQASARRPLFTNQVDPDYDPFEGAEKRVVKVKTLKDPTKALLHKKDEEDAIVSGKKSTSGRLRRAGHTAVNTSTGRESLKQSDVSGARWTLPPTWWGTGILESTSYAYTQKVAGAGVKDPRTYAEAGEKLRTHNRDRIMGDHYVHLDPSTTTSVVRTEEPKPTKKTFKLKPTRDMLRTELNSVRSTGSDRDSIAPPQIGAIRK